MSLISVVACKYYISIMTDGRIVDQNNRVLDENFNKIKSYDNNLYFSAWGSKEVFDEIAMVLDKLYASSSTAYVDEATNVILTIAKKSTYTTHPFILLWGGRNDGRLKICQLRTPKKEMEAMTLVDNGYISLMGTNKAYAFKFIDLELSNMVVTNLDMVVNAQKKTIEYVSTKDIAVNNTIFTKLIKL